MRHEKLLNITTGECEMERYPIFPPKFSSGILTNRVLINRMLNIRGGTHSHAADYFTLILWGGYTETFRGKTRYRPPGYISFRKAHEFHSIETKHAISLLILSRPYNRARFIKDGKMHTALKFIRKVSQWVN
jgi:hypothetical protein